MAKKKAIKKEKQDKEAKKLTLEYDLYSLPTAQHKAGLAGLLLLIDTMQMSKMNKIPEIKEITETGCKIVFDPKSMQSLFDYFFDAHYEESERNQIKKNRKGEIIEPKRIEERIVEEGNKKKEKRVYIYDDTVPTGDFLRKLLPQGGDGWIKLWRDMLWNTLRAIPRTRLVYEERAEDKKSSEALRNYRYLSSNMIKYNISTSLYIGAQNVNAENVPFLGGAKENFLLYFWTIASLIFQPRLFDNEGNYTNFGYVIVVPEPSNLSGFVKEVKTMIRSLDTKMVGFRPEASLIDLPAEGGLEYLINLTGENIRNKELSYSINSLELYHLERQGDNVKIHEAGKILPSRRLLNDYRLVKEECKNPLNKIVRINNLLAGNEWYDNYDSIFSFWPMRFFISSSGEKKQLTPLFSYEILDKFRRIEKKMKGGAKMTDLKQEEILAVKVYRLIRDYVNQRIMRKNGLTDNKDIYSFKYHEDRETVCSDAFLAMRGRREKDFIEYFTGTICSVPQFLPEEDYLLISQTLMTDWEKIKTLSMLAISACSYTSKPKENEGGSK